MRDVYVVIPALNEERSIARVIGDIPPARVEEVVVVSNGSTDRTVEVARKAGATVLSEPRKGYGFACLNGIDYLLNVRNISPESVLVFLDGDYSDFPGELPLLLGPLDAGCDLVIGSRATGHRISGSMTPQQIFGNWLATRLIRWLYGVRFTDLGPFRAIRLGAYLRLNMADKTYGWTVEMQVKAAKLGLKCCEVPVSYRPRIGSSKVSGTVKGTLLAGYKILYTIFKEL